MISPSAKQVGCKRLAVYLLALRQHVWERFGERTDSITSSSGDYPRWIDTFAMIADPLTKVMKTDILDNAMATGGFDMRPTAESLMIKAKNRELRRKPKVDDAS